MEHALSTAIITVALIAISISAMGIAYTYALQIQDAPILALRSKIFEIAAALEQASSLEIKRSVHGISMGRFIMESIDMGYFNITLELPGGIYEIKLNRIALKGLGIIESFGNSFNFGQPSIRVLNNEFIVPSIGISYFGTDVEMNSNLHTIVLRIPLIQNFKASGTFTMNIIPMDKKYETHVFELSQEGLVNLRIDGEHALSINVKIGDKIKIVVNYILIKLEKHL
ncbi:MAG: hypothetical protein NZ922_02460 [Candidatus Methanomethyliaceae archaeon]|nr:hypothetical protein [Candidatus Methanomethyliaceae archaeon]MDW7970974.1 hypothetical protein [Nitrososphaerota archaeon]